MALMESMKVLAKALMELEMDLMHIADIIYMFQQKEEDLSAKLLSWINDNRPTKEEIRQEVLNMAYPKVEYRNDFHKQWTEACMKERERTQSMIFSAEYARAQSLRMEAVIKKENRMAQLAGKRRRKKGLTDEDINKEIEELNNIIAECEEVIRKHPPTSRNSEQNTAIVFKESFLTEV